MMVSKELSKKEGRIPGGCLICTLTVTGAAAACIPECLTGVLCWACVAEIIGAGSICIPCICTITEALSLPCSPKT